MSRRSPRRLMLLTEMTAGSEGVVLASDGSAGATIAVSSAAILAWMLA